MSRRIPAVAIAASLFLTTVPSTYAQLDPNSFPSLGPLNVSSVGTITINTNTLTLTAGGTTYTGVAFAQAGGLPIAVFDFSGISIPSGSAFTVTGSQPLALLCQGNATMPGISVSSLNAGTAVAGGYLGGAATSPNAPSRVPDAEVGLGPGGGLASINLGASGGGYGGSGGMGISGNTYLAGGLTYGGLPQPLQGGSGGGATANTALTNLGGAGGGALEVVATGNLTIGNVFANGSTGNGGSNGSAGGGAGGSILLSAGGNLSMGSLTASGGAGGGGSVNPSSFGGGGGGGCIMIGGEIGGYTLGNALSGVTVSGGNGSPGTVGSGAPVVGAAGVVTVDSQDTTIQGGYSVTLNGTPVYSVSGNGQTSPNVVAFVRHNLTLGLGATVTFGMDNALYTTPGVYTANVSMSGGGDTFNLNGFSQTINQLNGGYGNQLFTPNIQIPAGSTLTVGNGDGSGNYGSGGFGQITGTGAFVKTGAGTQTISSVTGFSGSVTVTGGVLAVTNDMALPNSTITLAGGTLSFPAPSANPTIGALAGTSDLALIGITSLTVGGNNASTTYTGNLSGSAGLIIAGTGTFTLGGTPSSGSFTGTTTVNAGTLAVANDLVLQNSTVTLAGGSLAFATGSMNPMLGAMAGTGTVNLTGINSLTAGGNGASTAFSGSLTGSAALIKAGTGNMTLSSNLGGQFTGPITVTGGTLAIGNDQALANSVVTLNGGTLSFVSPSANPSIGALAGVSNLALSGINSLTVGAISTGSTTYSGALSGSLPGGLIKAGAGTWTLAGSVSNTFALTIQGGTVVIGSTGVQLPNEPVTINAGATLNINGFNETFGSIAVNGTVALGGAALSVPAGSQTVTGQIVNGIIPNGAYTVQSGGVMSGVTTGASSFIFARSGSTFSRFTNSGSFQVTNTTSPVALNQFTNQGSGSITLTAGSTATAADFQSYGTVMLAPGTASAVTILKNNGTTPLYFNGGSRTFIGTATTAINPATGQPADLAGINLNGQNAVVAGGLLVNNGFVADGSAGGTATIVADFGSLVKGAGFFQNSVITQNGGKFQAGNSPGSATFGNFVLGPGGVVNYVFAIDDATGTAGPSPDALGHVSGWGLVKSIQQTVGSMATGGSFTWTATPADPLTVALDTLVNPTIVGTDVAGPMADFDPSQSYSWPAVQWTGKYAGPTDTATLNADTAFDTSGFLNPINGTFGWSLDPADQTLSLTYTPTPVPEPGTLALTALAGLGWVLRQRRRNRLAAAIQFVSLMAVLVATVPAARGQLNPYSFHEIGQLNLSSPGTVTFNTNTLTATGDGFTYTGVSFAQTGGPPVAVFNFGSLTIPTGSTINVTGSRPLAILAFGNVTLPNISVSPFTQGSTVAGGYAGGVAVAANSTGQIIDAEPGAGPGGGAASLNLGANGAGYGGVGASGLNNGAPYGGSVYGSLPQILQGGSGGGAVSNTALANYGGNGGGAIEVAVTGNLTIGSVSANGAGGGGGSNGCAGGGAGGAIVLSAGGTLTYSSATAMGGSGSGDAGSIFSSSNPSGGGGGGGRIWITGPSYYPLGGPVGINCSGGQSNGLGSFLSPGLPGVVTVDPQITDIVSGFSVTLNGTPVASVTDMSGGVPIANVLSYARHSVWIESGASATLGMNNPLYTSPGNYTASLQVYGTLNLNGYSLAVDQFMGSGTVQIPAGSTFTTGTADDGSSYSGQFTGAGTIVWTGITSLALSGVSSFTGSTVVTNGFIGIDTNSALANSTITLAGGTLFYSSSVTTPTIGGLAGNTNLSLNGITSLTVGGNNASTTYSGNLTGSGALIKVGTGTLTLAGTSSSGSFTGTTTINAGTLALANDLVLQNSAVTLAGGTLAFAPGALNPQLGGLTGTGTVNLAGINSLTVFTSQFGSSPVFSGSLIGNAAFIKTGAGVLQIASNLGGQYSGPITISNGALLITNAQALANSVVTLAGGDLEFGVGQVNLPIGAVAGNTNLNIAPGALSGLTVGANGASTTYGGALSGSIPSGGLTKTGSGTWTLTGSLAYSGNLTVAAGTVAIGSSAFSMGNREITISPGATISANGFSLVSNNLLENQGTLALGGGSLTVPVAEYARASGNNGTILVTNGTLVGGSQNAFAGTTMSDITTSASTTVGASSGSIFSNFANGGSFTAFSSGVQLNQFTIQGSGSMTVQPSVFLSVVGLQSSGLITLPDASSLPVTELFNAGFSPMYFNSGSRTFIGAVGGNGEAQLELDGGNAVVTGGLFVNNGRVTDSSPAGTATIIADFGALVKGAGTYQNPVITQNGGKFQAGNSPGLATFGKFIFGPGGVNSYIFAIDNATGQAGPTPDANGQVSGWGLVKTAQWQIASGMTSGDFVWSATPADPLTVALDTLVNPTTVGTDVAGPMADFDPTQAYVWPAVQWTGAYSGPSDSATLNADTAFDTSGFLNPINGTFGWSLDSANDTLWLTYTPTPVPEPGTLALGGLAAAGLAGWRRTTGPRSVPQPVQYQRVLSRLARGV